MTTTIEKTGKGKSLDAYPLTRSSQGEAPPKTIVMSKADFATQVKKCKGLGNLPRKLWMDYKSDPSLFKRNLIIEFYAPWVQRQSERVASKLNASVQPFDIFASGVISVISSMETYQPERGILFTTYAMLRVKGGMLDQVRSDEWVPRLVITSERAIDEAVETASQELAREPFDNEIASQLGLSFRDYETLKRKAKRVVQISLDEKRRGNGETASFGEDRALSLSNILENKKSQEPPEIIATGEILDFAMRFLSGKDKSVVYLYYKKGLSLREAGEQIGVSESRACQLRVRAIETLHKALLEYAEDLTCTK